MKYIDLLKQYVGHSDKITKILDMGEYYGSTNSSILIMIPKSMIPEGVSPDDISVNPPDTSFIFQSPKRETPFEFTLQQLINALEQVPKIQDHEDCKDCDGWGKTDCSCCGSEIECESCDGSGEGDPIPGQFSYNSEYCVKIDKSYISAYNASCLVHVLSNTGIYPNDIIKLVSSDYLSPHLFEAGEIKFVSVPVNGEYISKENMVKVC